LVEVVTRATGISADVAIGEAADWVKKRVEEERLLTASV
jgi:hypothetical protein